MLNEYNNETAFMRIKDVLKAYPISKSHLWNQIRSGEFPQPIKLSPRVTVFKRAEVMAFLNNLAEGGSHE